MTRTIAIGAALVALLVAGSVGAATPEAERTARAHFQAGEARFKAGAFDEALAAYQAGYDVLPLPGFLINVAQCQRRLGDLKTARATYQKFVLVAPDSPLLPQVRSMIAEIDGLLAKPEPDEPAEADEAAKPASTLTAAAPTETPAPLLARASDPAPEPAPRRRWWLWGAIGAVVVGGAVTAVVLSTGGSTTIHDGSLATLRR